MAATSRSEPAVDKGHFLCQCLLLLRTGQINLKHHYQVSIPWSIPSIRSSLRLIRRPRCRVAACELVVCDVRLSDPRIRGPAAGGSSNLRLPPRPPCAAHRALGFEHAAIQADLAVLGACAGRTPHHDTVRARRVAGPANRCRRSRSGHAWLRAHMGASIVTVLSILSPACWFVGLARGGHILASVPDWVRSCEGSTPVRARA